MLRGLDGWEDRDIAVRSLSVVIGTLSPSSLPESAKFLGFL